jgi:hypothetical protein
MSCDSLVTHSSVDWVIRREKEIHTDAEKDEYNVAVWLPPA